MAAGTFSRGGPVVRTLALFAGLSVVLSLSLAAPARVWAADPFMREVRFPPEQHTGDIILFNMLPGSCSSGEELPGGVYGPPTPGARQGPADESVEVRSLPGVSEGDGCRTTASTMSAITWAYTEEDVLGSGTHYDHTQWGQALRVEATYRGVDTTGNKRLKVTWINCTEGIAGSPACDATVRQDTIATSVSGATISVDTLVTPPAGAHAFYFVTETTGGTNHFVRFTSLRLTTEIADSTYGGDCVGTAGVGGDGGLVWGSSGLSSATHPDTWGDYYSPTYLGCRYSVQGYVDYVPPEGFGAGDSWHVGLQVASTSGNACVASAYFILPGPSILNILSINYQGANPGGAAGPGADIAAGVLPADVSALRFAFGKYCFLQAVYVANVTGDPVLDDGYGTWPPPSPGSEDIFAACDPPTNPLDVPGWLAFGACVVVTGFTSVLGAIAGIAISIGQDAWEVMLDVVGPWFSEMFVPVDLGADWAAFMDTAGAKVPFGWFAQAWDAISDGLGAPVAELGSLAFTMGGTEVDVGDGISSAVGAVAPFRGLLTAGVVLTMGLSLLRWVMAAVGVSPGGGGAQE